MERTEYGRNSDFFGNASSMKSTSPRGMEDQTDAAIDKGDAAEVDTWKDALISRNMDLVNCCLQAVLGDLPASERMYIGKLMTAVLKEVEDITVGKVELKARSIFTTLTPEDVEVEKPTQNKGGNDMPKSVPNSKQIPIPYRYPRKTLSIKSFICPGCDRFVSEKSYCPACNNLIVRVRRDLDSGIPLPTCHHEDYRGAPKCRSCRYNKYTDLWRCKGKTIVSPKPKDVELTCLGCQTRLDKTASSCSSCFFLVRKILKARTKGTPMPSCKHLNYSGCPVCESCRLRRFLNKENMSSYKCGSCLKNCQTDTCRSCFNFGTSLEKAYGANLIPECRIHQNRKGAPSCINCRYHLWKEGKKLSVDESPKKPQEKDLDIKPDLKRIKMEV